MQDLDAMLLYMVLAVVVGARLGHCLFYEPEYYLSHPFEILKIWKGGLASHGATLGILITIFVFSRKYKDHPFLYVLDRMAIVVALGGFFIRAGNLMNSEIIGKPTNQPWGFVFAHHPVQRLMSVQGIEDVEVNGTGRDTTADGQRYTEIAVQMEFKRNRITPQQLAIYLQQNVPQELTADPADDRHFAVFATPKVQNISTQGNLMTGEVLVWGIPRHPSQLYESLSTLLVFFVLAGIWLAMKGATPHGLLSGLFLIIVFGLRFVWEYLKENQVDFEDQMDYNLGQLLSIPLVTLGVILVVRAWSRRKLYAAVPPADFDESKNRKS